MLLSSRRVGRSWLPAICGAVCAGAAAATPASLIANIDRVTPDHPVLLRRYDGLYFVNTKGFQLARIDRNTPDPANGKGSITAGKLADLIVLTRNIRTIPTRDIPTAKVSYTISDGRIIYAQVSDGR